VFVVDAKRETIAVREANRLGIPVVAITDTNADPSPINFPIPGNDDAIRSVGLICAAIASTIEQARREVPEDQRRTEDAEATTYSTETGETTEKERPARKRPRRKRRPRPEVIAQHMKSDDEAEAAEAQGEEPVAEDAPAAAPPAPKARKPRAKKPATAAVAEGGEEVPEAE
jgi:small subunit ribosomal protein S2